MMFGCMEIGEVYGVRVPVGTALRVMHVEMGGFAAVRRDARLVGSDSLRPEARSAVMNYGCCRSEISLWRTGDVRKQGVGTSIMEN